MNTDKLEREFPDFPLMSLPDLGKLSAHGFVDSSRRNYRSPCFVKGNVTVWVDYPDTESSEFPDGVRFVVVEDGGRNYHMNGFVDWAEAEAWALRAAANPPPA